MNTEKGGFKPFDTIGEETNVSQRWDRYIKSFELFIEANAINSDKRKRALLLHHAGESVQEVWYALPEADREYGPNEDVYEICKKSLTDIFKPRRNYTYERHLFRALAQKEDEGVIQFVSRLKTQSRNCNFKNSEDEMIIDQLIEKCKSTELRRQLLKEGDTLTVDRAQELGRILETSEKQAGNIEAESKYKNNGQEIRRIEQVKRYEKNNKIKIRCYRCDQEGHVASDPDCPAKNKKCKKCSKLGHFQKCCKTKPSTEDKRKKVRNLEEQEMNDGDYTFRIRNENDSTDIDAWIGGVRAKFLIDSGSTCNVLDRENWENLKKNKIQGKCHTANKKIFTYSSEQPLPTLGVFSTSIKLMDGRSLENIDFYVVAGKGVPILGKETARELGILKIGLPLRNIEMEKNTEVQDRFQEVFCEKVGKLKDYQLKLSINEETKPIAQVGRRMPHQLKQALKERLDELAKADIIEKVDQPSRWVSPIVCTIKKNGELRLCVDMRAANDSIIRERHPIPSISDMLVDMKGSRYYSKIDLRSAFHQIELEEGSREITTFATFYGLYRFKRLFFGISCAPEIFQRTMEQMIGNLKGVIIYIDDFLVHGKSREEHDKNLYKLLERLKSLGLTANTEKCYVGLEEVEFMGHLISEKGIKPLKSKVKAIEQCRPPETKTELLSFLGLIGYCSRFIPDFSTLTEPLRELTRKNTHFKWENRHQVAFKNLKNALVKQGQVLGFYDPDAQSTIIADASPYGLGAVLVQCQDGENKIIEFASRALSDTEKKYSQTEKEALSLVWACERFHTYVYGTEFEIITDHKPLEFIFSPKSKPCPRVERWVMRLMGYRFRVRYSPGKTNIADPLSRMGVGKGTNSYDDAEEHVTWIVQEAIPSSMTVEEIRDAYQNDSYLAELKKAIQSNKWPVNLRKYEIIKTELCVVDEIILRGTRILIPSSLRTRVLKLAHEGHPGIVKMKQRLRTKIWWNGLDKDVGDFCKRCHGCQLVGAADPPEPVNTSRLPDKPWQTIALDFMGPVGEKYILVAIDYYSRFYEARIMSSITAENTIDELENMFMRFGIPEEIIADNGRQFISAKFRDFCLINGIKLSLNTPK